MLVSYTGLPKHYSSLFSQLAVKKYSGKYEEGSLELLIKQALDHMKLWKPEPYSENLPLFISAIKHVGSAKDAAYEKRQELLKEALELIEKHK